MIRVALWSMASRKNRRWSCSAKLSSSRTRIMVGAEMYTRPASTWVPFSVLWMISFTLVSSVSSGRWLPLSCTSSISSLTARRVPVAMRLFSRFFTSQTQSL